MIRSIILLAYGLLITLLALRSLRAQRLKERYVLLFLFAGSPFVILAFWPDGVVWATELLNIEKATLMVLALAAFVILIIFQLFSIISVQERRIAALTQLMGIINEERTRSTREQKPSPKQTPQPTEEANDTPDTETAP